MKFAIIVSKKDPAGMNIKQRFLEGYGFKEISETFDSNLIFKFQNAKLYTIEKESIFFEDIDKQIDADMFIFATKHRAKSGIPSLSVHVTGNWSEDNSFGGKERELCVAMPCYMKKALVRLNELNDLDFEIIQECTHHGPYLEKPMMFIEIGSSEKQWDIKRAGEIVAETIMFLVTSEISKYKTAFAIGGLHHMPSFKKIMLNSDVAIGHCCPKYALNGLDSEMLHQAVKRSRVKCDLIILDWKGLGEFKEKIKKLVDESGLEVKRTKEF